MELETEATQSFTSHPPARCPCFGGQVRRSSRLWSEGGSRFPRPSPHRRAHFAQSSFRALGFIRARIQANYGAKLADGGGFLAEFGKAEPLSHPGRGRLE